MTTWIFFALRLLLAIATAGVGATLVRQAHSRSGILLAAAGGLEILTACCIRGIVLSLDRSSGNVGLVFHGITFLGTLVHLVYAGLVIGALLGLAKELASRKQSGVPAAPPAGGAPPVLF
ncbi:MAG: hypothetical protein IT378_13935 [Sandaracinaceae bacterium]|nr:hypothetical protein [Sandaracinaceae bacterium]